MLDVTLAILAFKQLLPREYLEDPTHSSCFYVLGMSYYQYSFGTIIHSMERKIPKKNTTTSRIFSYEKPEAIVKAL